MEPAAISVHGGRVAPAVLAAWAVRVSGGTGDAGGTGKTGMHPRPQEPAATVRRSVMAEPQRGGVGAQAARVARFWQGAVGAGGAGGDGGAGGNANGGTEYGGPGGEGGGP